MIAQPARAVPRIRIVDVADIRDLDAHSLLPVEHVVHEEQLAGIAFLVDSRGVARAIGLAREVGRVAHVICVLPDEVEFIEEVGRVHFVGVEGLDEGYQAAFAVDHFS